MKFALTAFVIFSCLVAASLAADDKCKFANFEPKQTLQTGSKQVVEWQCKGNAKNDLIYIEIGSGKTPDEYAYVDTIDAKAKASLGKFSFILKDEYPSGDYLARMLTIGAKETLPVEEAERAKLPWTYTPTFEIENSKESDDNSSSNDGNTTNSDDDSNDDTSPSSSSRNNSSNRNTTDNQNDANQANANAADAVSIFGSTVLFCAGVLTALLVL